MKVKNYIFFGLFLLLRTVSASAQCSPVDAGDDRAIVCGDSIYLLGQPKWSRGLDSTTSYFRSVFFTDSIIGYTVGDNGVIRKTVNGGLSWTSQTSGVTNNLQSVVFTNATTGYVVGENGVILKTINGGVNWTTQTSSTTNTLYSVCFTDANTGIAVGTNGVILKTVNAGVNWSTRKSNLSTNLISVDFANTSVGYVTSEGKIIKTTDGGETWKTIQNVSGNIYIRIYFTSINVGYVTLRDANGANTILKTTDGGVSWTILNVSSAYPISSLFFTDVKTGYAGSVGRIFKTNDGGMTWESQQVDLINVEDIYFPNPRTGYAVGSSALSKNTLSYKMPDAILWAPAIGLSSPTIINPAVSPVTSTTYTLTTRSGTCIQKDTIRITVAPLTVNVGNDQRMVCGGSVKLTNIVSNYFGKLQYSWLPKTGLNDASIANPTVTIKQTTTYTLTVKTPNGCTAKDSVKIIVDPLVANAGSDKSIICGGNTKLPVVTSNYTGAGTLTYSWLPTTGLDFYNVPEPVTDAIKETNYLVTITTADGCKATDSISVFVTPLKVSAGNDKTLTCGGGVQLDQVVSNYTGNGKLTYSWVPVTGINNPAGMNPFVTITKPETFHVVVTTPNGCTAKDTVMVDVKPLTLDAGADKLHFCGDTVTLNELKSNYNGIAQLTYSWVPTTGLNNATIANPVSSAGKITYTVTVATENGCKASDSLRLQLKNRKGIEMCMVGVDSTGANKISWNHPVSSVIDLVFIYKEVLPTGFVKIAEVPYAAGEFVDSTSVTNTKSDKYKISVLDSCGMESTHSEAHKGMHLSVKKGTGVLWDLTWESYEGFPVSNYFIYRGKNKSNLQLYGAVSGTTEFTDMNPLPGMVYYQVEILSPNACEGTTGNSVRSNITTGNAVGINEVSDELSFNIFPNPTNNMFTVTWEGSFSKELTLTIYNTLGSVVKSVLLQQNQQQIDVNDLSNGFYLVELKSDNGHLVRKLAIEK